MGRRKSPFPKVRVNFYIREDLASKIELLAYNPGSSLPRYGVRNQIVEAALTQYFAKLEKEQEAENDN